MAESLTFKFSGDTAKGRNYVGFAKAAVADLHNLMELGDLNSYGLSKIFDDGTAIHVKTDYGISVVNIHCPIITEEVKPIIEEEFYQVTSFVVGVFPTTQAGIRLKRFAVTEEGLAVTSECVVKDLTIDPTFTPTDPYSFGGLDSRNVQCIWDAILDCYQLFIGNVSGEHPHVLQYPIDIDGNILEVGPLKPGYLDIYQPEYSLLPNQHASIELRETDLTENGLCYLYYGTQSYALLDTNFAMIKNEEENVEGSWIQPYYAFELEQYPTYSIPQPTPWDWSNLKTVLREYDEPTGEVNSELDGTMVIMHGWVKPIEGQAYGGIREYRIIYENHQKHTAVEWMIPQEEVDFVGRDATGWWFSLSNRMLQVENKLWYFEDSYKPTNAYRRESLFKCSLRIADVQDPLNYSVVDDHVSSLAGSAIYTRRVWLADAWNETETVIHTVTDVVIPLSMVYCKEEGVVLISKVRWDNTGLGDYETWTGNGSGATYGTGPNGTLTTLIDAYSVDGKLLHSTELEVISVPDIYRFSLHGRGFCPEPVPQAEWDSYSRYSKLGYSKIKKLIQL